MVRIVKGMCLVSDLLKLIKGVGIYEIAREDEEPALELFSNISSLIIITNFGVHKEAKPWSMGTNYINFLDIYLS